MKALIQMQYLCKNNPSGTSLRDCSLTLYEGEVLGIMGYQNSGKTLLLRILSKEEEFDEGTVFLYDKKIYEKKFPDKFPVTFIHNQYVLAENLSVADNIFYVRNTRASQIITRNKLYHHLLKKHLEEFHLNIEPETKISVLNRVDKCIVMILKAFLRGSQVILIDDFVDTYSKEEYQKINAFLLQLKKRRISFIISGCNYWHLELSSDKILLMNHGHLKKLDTAFLPKVSLPVASSITLEACSCPFELWNHIYSYVSDGKILAVVDYENKANPALFSFLKHQLENTAFSNSNSVCEDFEMQQILIPFMSLEDNLCLKSYERFKEFGIIRSSRLKYIRKVFLQWYPKYSVPNEPDCTHVDVKDLLAIRLYRILLQNPRTLVCSNPPLITFEGKEDIILKTFATLKEQKTSIILLTNNLEQVNCIAEQFLFINSEQPSLNAYCSQMENRKKGI